jgi:hypothetical protein
MKGHYMTINELRGIRSFIAIIGLLVVSACASPVPQAELDAYRSAFTAARTANEAFLEQFASAERALKSTAAADEFIAQDAAYYATSGKPPLTTQIERAFNAIAAYNDVLTTLAEGRSWDAIRPQIDRAATSFSVLAGLAGPQGAAVGAAIPLAGNLINELGSALRGVTDRKQAQQLIVDHTDDVVAVIDTLIKFSPDIHGIVQDYFKKAQATAATENRMDDARAFKVKAESTSRTLVANWVVLLQDTKGALENLKAAAAEGSLSGPDLANIAFWSEEVSNHAVAVQTAAMALAEKF